MTTCECENQWILALQFADLTYHAGVIRQRIVRKNATGNDVRAHVETPLSWVCPIFDDRNAIVDSPLFVQGTGMLTTCLEDDLLIRTAVAASENVFQRLL